MANPAGPTGHSDASTERFGLGLAIVITVLHAVIQLDANSLWLDEGYTLGATNDLWSSLTRTHGTMGLYYVIMWGWAWLGDATWWLRLPSVLFAIATLCLLRPLARRIGGSRLVAVALPMAALLPMFQAKAIEARSYSLLTLVTCASWYVLVRALDAPNLRTERQWFIRLIPLSLVGVFTHGLFVIHLSALGAVILLGPSAWRRIVRFIPALGSATLVMYILHSLGASGIGTRILGGPPWMARATVQSYFPDSFGPRLILLQLFLLGSVLTVRQVVRSHTKLERAIKAIPISMAIVPCIVLALTELIEPRYSPRYLAPIGLGIAMVIGSALVHLDHVVGGAVRRPIARVPLGLASILALAIATFGLAATPHENPDDWRGAARLVASEGRETDGIIFANRSVAEPMLHRVPFEAAWREAGHDAPPAMVSPSRPLGKVIRFDDPLPLDDVIRTSTQYQRIWVIEHQQYGLDHTQEIVDSLVELGFTVITPHTLPGQISLVLLEQH